MNRKMIICYLAGVLSGILVTIVVVVAISYTSNDASEAKAENALGIEAETDVEIPGNQTETGSQGNSDAQEERSASESGTAGISSEDYRRLVCFNFDSGVYSRNLLVRLESDVEDVTLYYTLDGEDPDRTSKVYRSGVALECPPLEEISVVPFKVAVYSGSESLGIYERTYVLERNGVNPYNLDILCITIDPDELYDYDRGLLVEGKTFEEKGYKSWGDKNGNYDNTGEDWTRAASVMMIGTDNSIQIAQGKVGFSLSGGSSRSYSKKSFKLSGDCDWIPEATVLNYDGFTLNDGQVQVSAYNYLKVHSCSQDQFETCIRNAVYYDLAGKAGFNGYFPVKRCAVFLNDEFYTVASLEPVKCKSYFADRYGLLEKDITLYETNEMSFMRIAELTPLFSCDLNREVNREKLEAVVDMEDWLRYFAIQILFNNVDWPGNNFGVWKYNGPKQADNEFSDGRYRTIMYDSDLTWLFNESRIKLFGDDVFNMIMDGSKPSLFDDVLKSDYYRGRFISIVQDLLATTFSEESITESIDNAWNDIEKAKIFSEGEVYAKSYKSGVEKLKERAMQRRKTILSDFNEHFGNIDQTTVTVTTDAGVNVFVNEIVQKESETSKHLYRKDALVKLTAVPYLGYRFTGFEVNGQMFDEEELLLNSADMVPGTITVHAERIREGTLAITEVHSAGKEDYVILKNIGEREIRIAECYLSDHVDDPDKYLIPSYVLKAGEELRIAGEKNTDNGNVNRANFNLSTGEILYLFDADGSMLDHVEIRRMEDHVTYRKCDDGLIRFVSANEEH